MAAAFALAAGADVPAVPVIRDSLLAPDSSPDAPPVEFRRGESKEGLYKASNGVALYFAVLVLDLDVMCVDTGADSNLDTIGRQRYAMQRWHACLHVDTIGAYEALSGF